MLAQRIVKAYCQIGLGVRPESSKKQLEEVVSQFGRQLSELEQFAPAPKIEYALSRVRIYWSPFARAAAKPVTRDGAEILSEFDDELLFATDQVVILIEEAAGTPNARLINIAGRQRMLGQRLAKLYMLKAWGFDHPRIQSDSDRARFEFDGALRELQKAPQNTSILNQQLATAASRWNEFAQALTIPDKASPQRVADLSEDLLHRMDEITRLYETLLSRK